MYLSWKIYEVFKKFMFCPTVKLQIILNCVRAARLYDHKFVADPDQY